jgi:glycerol-1-phosphate dehydrogenase [NAD(P)+]
VAGKSASAFLKDAGWKVSDIIVPDPAPGKTPVCDNHTYDELIGHIGTADVILPVGSGVLSDLGKWIAANLNVPCVGLATAASMNGYTSANVAATINGVKTLLRKRSPLAILSDPDILGNAPYELTAAGLGDALAKSVSSADWRMNNFLFGDYFCQGSIDLVAETEPLYMNHPEDLLQRKPEAIGALFHSLLLSGVAMTMAETSAPASGGEHLISHTLDMMSALDGAPHDLHGRQVGIGTVLASEIYRRIISMDSPSFSPPAMEIDKKFWKGLAGEVEIHFAPKRARLQKAYEILSRGAAWDRLREAAALFIRLPDQIHGCLKRAGAACRARDIGSSQERLVQAVIHAHEIRSRFTVIDLARLVGVLPGEAVEIVEQWS